MLNQKIERVPLGPILRRFVIVFVGAAVVHSVIVAIIYRQDVVHQQTVLDKEGRHVLDLQQELLSHELQTVQSDLRYLATQQALQQFVSGDASSGADLASEYVNFAIQKGIYDQIRYLALDGQEIIRVNYRDGAAGIVPKNELQSKAARYYYQQARSLESDEIFISTFDLNVERGQIEQPIKPVIRFATPVLDSAGQQRGFLVLNYLGARLLSQLNRLSSGFDGEAMLLNGDGEYLLASETDREWGWLLGHDFCFPDDYPEAWRQVHEQTGGTTQKDGNSFLVQHISLGITSLGSEGASAPAKASPKDDSLILVARISAATTAKRSATLLQQLLYLSVAALFLITLLSWYWARTNFFRRYHEQQIADSEHRLRQLSSQLLDSQETERRNLSRDLHDEIGQQATAISLDLQSIRQTKDPEAAKALLDRSIEETGKLLQSLHEIARQVRPRVLDDLGLHDAVESLIGEYTQRTGVDVTSDLQFERERIPSRIGENVFRIVQEALANVASHAQVDEAEVTIRTNERSVVLKVRDEGMGFNLAEASGSKRLGILGMRERVELLDGEFEMESAPGSGTQVEIEIPLTDDETSS